MISWELTENASAWLLAMLKLTTKIKGPLVRPFFIIAIISFLILALYFFLPFHKTLERTLPTDFYINLPCQSVFISPSKNDENKIKLEILGRGFGKTKLNQKEEQVQLLKIGLFRHLNCKVSIELSQNGAVYLPISMPFVARGVRPIITEEAPYAWRRIEGLR